MKEYRKFWIALVVMALLSPLGLYLPKIMKAGSAWGEWGVEEVKQLLGYAPPGMDKTADTWKAPMPGYALPGQENASLSRVSLSYIFSAFIGVVGCGGGTCLLVRWLTRRKV